jgi:Putative transposase/Transposase zinc-binding domain
MSIRSMAGELQQVFGKAASHPFNPYSKQVFTKLHDCHTAAIGVHTYKCSAPGCNHLHHQYHSCGNRHCPNCGGLKKEQWIENLTADLLPTAYYHVVFTLPHELHPVILGNRKELFKLLFDAASQTLLQFAQDPKYLGGKCSITTVLHTWGQQLGFHPHLHCIVSGGGVDANNKWVAAKRKNDKFLFPVPAMKPVFKVIFLKGLRLLIQKDELQIKGIDTKKIIEKAGYKKWKVHAQSPFGNVANVVEYLGRYTHKIAITTHRIISISEDSVRFKYKDYTDGDKQKEMTLSITEFLRRFELHILPKRFVKIRHYGLLQNHGKIKRLNVIRQQLRLSPLPVKVQVPVGQRMLEKYGKDIMLCPKCNKGKLVWMCTTYAKQDNSIFRKKLNRDEGMPSTLNNKASP